jgi:hypothetical protein
MADLAEDQWPEAISRIVHGAVCDLVGERDPKKAWGKLFRPSDVVAIKISCLAPGLSPSPALIDAVVAGVTSVGVPAANIIVYDKEDRDLIAAGFETRTTGDKYRCYGTIGPAGGPGYEDVFETLHDTTVRLTKIATEQATAIINVPVVKDHIFAGITGALKNHFGTINNPEDFHLLDGCNPAVADVCTSRTIRSKERLCLCDALRVLYDGGPALKADAVVDYWGVLASHDPVAMDQELWYLIDTVREQNDLPTLAKCDPPRPPKHIATAAGYRLGTNDPNAIELRQYDLAQLG